MRPVVFLGPSLPLAEAQALLDAEFLPPARHGDVYAVLPSRPDAIVLRHSESGAAALVARHVQCPVINAGDGCHEHPTQALLDLLTIRERRGDVEGLTVAIVGDLLHSRVGRSNLHALTTLGARVRLVGPPTLVPRDLVPAAVEVRSAAEWASAAIGR